MNFHLTPEATKVKRVTKEAPVNCELFPYTPQVVVQYIPVVIHTPLPPPPPMANAPAFFLNKYAPLALPQVLNDMPQDYFKILPRFNGENEIDVQKNLETFFSFAENFNVEHLDVVLILFVQSLVGEARKWFRKLADRSVTTWERME